MYAVKSPLNYFFVASEQQISQSPTENDEAEICNEEAMPTGTGREDNRINNVN